MAKQRREAQVSVRVYADMVEVSVPGRMVPEENLVEHKRGEVRGLSPRARHRMMRALSMVRDMDDALFLTLTYPDHFPPTHEEWKADWAAFRKRVLRRWPEAGGVWRVELGQRQTGENQGLEAPHYHVLARGLTPPTHDRNLPLVERALWRDFLSDERFVAAAQAYARRYVARYRKPFPLKWRKRWLDAFRVWLSLAWADIVAKRTGYRDPAHEFVGTSCSYVTNRRHAAWYISKYMAKREGDGDGVQATGRMWGLFGTYDCRPVGALRLKMGEWRRLRRLLIAWLRAVGSPYGDQLAEQSEWLGCSVFGLGADSRFAGSSVAGMPGVWELLASAQSGETLEIGACVQ